MARSVQLMYETLEEGKEVQNEQEKNCLDGLSGIEIGLWTFRRKTSNDGVVDLLQEVAIRSARLQVPIRRLPLLCHKVVARLGRTFLGNTHANMRQCPLRTACRSPLPSNHHPLSNSFLSISCLTPSPPPHRHCPHPTFNSLSIMPWIRTKTARGRISARIHSPPSSKPATPPEPFLLFFNSKSRV